MKLLGISGGPDSMLLLNKYKNKKIVVAHVNYNIRSDSHIDESIVDKFCKKNNIFYEVLSLNKKPKTNFQNWAREKRFNFFEKIYKKYNCKSLLLAHHKDDFLETAIMQKDSKRTPKYFGIKKVSYLKDMKIYRPFIDKYWKEQILTICKNQQIEYAIDSSNKESIYTRNKIRLELEKINFKEKEKQYKWFCLSNRILMKKHKKIDFCYKAWSKTNFSLMTFNHMNYKNELLYNFLHDQGNNINITTNKLESIIDWIKSQNSKREYKIAANQFIQKNNKCIKIIILNNKV